MTITTRNAISACIAFREIWLPQLAPTYWTLTWSGVRWNVRPSAVSTLFRWAGVSWWVCTVQLAACFWELVTYWTMASLPPPAAPTVLRTWEMVAVPAGNWKTEPPLKSTLKLSPNTARAITLTARITPEMVYQSRWRPTNSIETSPRYSLPPMPPSADITPPLPGSAGPGPGPPCGAGFLARVPGPRAGPGRGRTTDARRRRTWSGRAASSSAW